MACHYRHLPAVLMDTFGTFLQYRWLAGLRESARNCSLCVAPILKPHEHIQYFVSLGEWQCGINSFEVCLWPSIFCSSTKWSHHYTWSQPPSISLLFSWKTFGYRWLFFILKSLLGCQLTRKQLQNLACSACALISKLQRSAADELFTQQQQTEI